MDKDDYLNLIEWHRSTQRSLTFLQFQVGLIFVIVVLGPILKQFGLWDLFGFGG